MLPVADLAVELAVRKGAGAALAELHVAFRGELGPAPQREGVDGALPDRPAALDDQRAQAHLRQDQPGQQPARPGADHHRTAEAGPARLCRPAIGDEAVAHVRGALDVAAARMARQHRILVAHRGVEGVDQAHGAAPPGVVAAPEQRVRQHVGLRHAETRRDRRHDRLRAVIERQLEFGESQHAGTWDMMASRRATDEVALDIAPASGARKRWTGTTVDVSDA